MPVRSAAGVVQENFVRLCCQHGTILSLRTGPAPVVGVSWEPPRGLREGRLVAVVDEAGEGNEHRDYLKLQK